MHLVPKQPRHRHVGPFVCTADGKGVKPVDMGWMEGSTLSEFTKTQIEKGPIEVALMPGITCPMCWRTTASN